MGWLPFPGGHGECVGAGCCGPAGCPPLTLPEAVSAAWGLWGDGEPQEAPRFPQAQQGPLKHSRLTAGRTKPTAAWRVGRSLSPPFCTPMSVARRKREGNGHAGMLARPCPNRPGRRASPCVGHVLLTQIVARQPAQTAETHRADPVDVRVCAWKASGSGYSLSQMEMGTPPIALWSESHTGLGWGLCLLTIAESLLYTRPDPSISSSSPYRT